MPFCVWFLLFVAGALVPTGPYRDTLSGNAGFWEKLPSFLIVVFCYTATNAAMLCCTASVIGGIFRRMKSRRRQRLLSPSLFVLLLSMVFQGFIVYLVMALGILSYVLGGASFDHPNRLQYVHLALTSSLIGLMIGYSPGLFNSLMIRLETWAEHGIPVRGAAPAANLSREVAQKIGDYPSGK